MQDSNLRRTVLETDIIAAIPIACVENLDGSHVLLGPFVLWAKTHSLEPEGEMEGTLWIEHISYSVTG